MRTTRETYCIHPEKHYDADILAIYVPPQAGKQIDAPKKGPCVQQRPVSSVGVKPTAE